MTVVVTTFQGLNQISSFLYINVRTTLKIFPTIDFLRPCKYQCAVITIASKVEVNKYNVPPKIDMKTKLYGI